jgi:hypothetical protein
MPPPTQTTPFLLTPAGPNGIMEETMYFFAAPQSKWCVKESQVGRRGGAA